MLTLKLAADLSAIDGTTLSAPVAEAARRHLLDGLGCLLAGGRGRLAHMARMAFPGPGPCSLYGLEGAAPPGPAAFVNAISLYSIALNDVHKEAGAHPGAVVLPALLAGAELKPARGADFIAAMVAGYDLMGRLGRAVMPAHRAAGFHPTGTLGPFAATAALGRLSGFDGPRLASALGIAGSQAAGLTCFLRDDSDTIYFHAARAAQNGVEACALAAAGMRGPQSVLEEPAGGFLSTFCPAPDAAALDTSAALGCELLASSLRPFYGCTYTIAATTAVARLLRHHSARRVTQIRLWAAPGLLQNVDRPRPENLLAARISLQFNVALVLHLGRPLIGEVSEALLRNPDLRAWLPKIALEPAADLPAWATRAELTFDDGTTACETITRQYGDPQDPMDDAAVTAKFYALVGQSAAARAVVTAVKDLQSAADCQALLTALAHCAAHLRTAHPL